MLSAVRRSAVGALRAPQVQRALAPTAVRSLSVYDIPTDKDYVEPPKEYTDKGALIVDNIAFSLEWVLSSPPPLHAFEEPPIIVEWPEGEEGHH
ncbi:Cytochrome c oxidase subunit 1 [Hondaea fermentalgiana]|uniref:Cytochrome c oxidase subunit 1 n=1 Tax=Hondaea fermentalgiana TaxID=2315210 RepID=A0A2R5GZD6_9STRA|nr:Cytochrome c oxidase subunit 1 [Hondaea fermentalgiana]|eukprot:GBG33394.1 Cytochrome c oxidase subunit 1 [Hondaea fermentalgiana]